jgi:hypothetical protein
MAITNNTQTFFQYYNVKVKSSEDFDVIDQLEIMHSAFIR